MFTSKEQSIYLDEGFLKKAFSGFERISFGTCKRDPFERFIEDDIWLIKGNKLLRNKKRGIKQ